MKNGNSITKVTFTKQLTAWCPLGQQSYIADVTVDVLPVNEIPDYCELEEALNGIDGEELIIEALATRVFSTVKKAFGNAPVKVTVDVKESAHMPVIVVKGDF